MQVIVPKSASLLVVEPMSLLQLVDLNSYDFDYISLTRFLGAGLCMDLYIKDAITPLNAVDHLLLRQVVERRDSIAAAD